MKKGVFCDQILRSPALSRGNYSKSEFRFERRDVASYIDSGLGFFIKANFWENQSIGERGAIDAGFLQVFESVPVLKNVARNVYYSNLPAVVLGTDGLGVYQVSPMQDESATFIPLMPATAGLYSGMPSEHLFGEAGVRQEGKKVIYKNISNLSCGEVHAVLMKLICSTEPLSMDDELPIPIDHIKGVQEVVLQFMTTGMQKPDTQQDQNPTTA